MKYRRLLVVPMAAVLFLLSACSGTGGAKPISADDVTYQVMHADWPRYETTQELVEEGTDILIGTVTDISYQVLDMKTAEPPTEKSEKLDCMLHTIYHVKVAKVYKGRVYDTVKVRMMGGEEGVRVEEQLKALGEDAVNGIPVMCGDKPNIEVGKTYLFVLWQHEAEMPTWVNTDQAVYELTETGAATTTGLPSLKDIVTYFGAEQWDELQKLLPEARK